ncbi:MAG: nucleotidyltransferase family protein, partial [Acidobacteriota bacterium]
IQALYRRHHFHLILQGDGRPPLELHWALSRPDDPCGLDPSELFDGARASPGTPALRVVSPENQLLHVAVSEHRFGFTDLRRLIDFDRQLRAAQGLDWNELARRAASSGLSRPLRMCLELAGDLLHAPVAEGLAALPELGSARRRLSKLGIEAFPLQLPPSNVTAARLLVRFWLSDDRWRAFVRLLRTAPFERERLAVLGVPAHRRAAAVLARLLRLVSMAATSLATGVKPYRHHTLTSIASPPSSARPGADTARTREPRA